MPAPGTMTDYISTTSESSTKSTTAILPGVAVAPLEWTSSFHRLRGDFDGRLGNGLRFLGLLLIIVSAVGLMTGKGFLAIFVGFLLVLIVGQLLVPVTYRLNSEGIERTLFGRRQFKPWVDFESARTNDLVLQLDPKNSLLRGRSRASLCIPLCQRGSTSCERLQRLMPLRVEYCVAEGAPPSSA